MDLDADADALVETVAKLTVDAVLGELALTMSSGMALAKTYKLYAANPLLRHRVVIRTAQLLAERAPLAAMKLVDHLGPLVGR